MCRDNCGNCREVSRICRGASMVPTMQHQRPLLASTIIPPSSLLKQHANARTYAHTCTYTH